MATLLDKDPVTAPLALPLAEPPLKPEELVDTLNLNACAMLSVLFGVNEVMGAQGSQLLTDEYQALERLTSAKLEQPSC
jgi:hypothetical protein